MPLWASLVRYWQEKETIAGKLILFEQAMRSTKLVSQFYFSINNNNYILQYNRPIQHEGHRYLSSSRVLPFMRFDQFWSTDCTHYAYAWVVQGGRVHLLPFLQRKYAASHSPVVQTSFKRWYQFTNMSLWISATSLSIFGSKFLGSSNLG